MAGARNIEPVKPITRPWNSALRPKTCLLARHGPLRELVASKLLQDWSPEQISGWLKSQYPKDASLRVSHETIYRSLFIQARGALKQELVRHLRSQRRIRRSRHSSVHGHSQGKIVDAISIRERPAEVEDRAIPGHIPRIASSVRWHTMASRRGEIGELCGFLARVFFRILFY